MIRRRRHLHTAEHQSMRMAPFTCTLLFFISFALQEGKRLRLLVLYPGATSEVLKVHVMVLGSKPFVRGPKGRVCSGLAGPSFLSLLNPHLP